MDQCEDREEGDPPSKTTLCGEPESQTKAQRPEKLHRPDSAGPEPGHICAPYKNNESADLYIHFKKGQVSDEKICPESPGSDQTDHSRDSPLTFRQSDDKR
ncbi:hypothetical protein EXN66_Car003990 [Channa argus]|uniref:Uncharacterized protein n=2 Tax=Channa argus TaxID=215402 RepID=A0A6G1PE71_CHAAH|nr:hypothetical protein EXN66_Car003990 [Channa argus]